FGVGARDLVHEEPVRSFTSILHLNRLSSGWQTPSGGRADAAMRSGPGSWQQIAPGCDNMTPVHVFIASTRRVQGHELHGQSKTFGDKHDIPGFPATHPGRGRSAGSAAPCRHGTDQGR